MNKIIILLFLSLWAFSQVHKAHNLVICTTTAGYETIDCDTEVNCETKITAY